MREPARPLPESLTRFLHPPRTVRTAPALATPGPRTSALAMRGALIWALAYNLGGAAILALLWLSMG